MVSSKSGVLQAWPEGSMLPSNPSTEDRPCILGCNANDALLFRGRDLLHELPGTYDVVRCGSCGLIRTNPRPTPGSMGYYYPEEYGPYKGTMASANARMRSRPSLIRRLARRVLELNIQRLPASSPGNLLEIGCASGAFLQQMKNKGWNVFGIEYSASASDTARNAGLDVYTGTVENAPDPGRRFDMVVGWMVLEHLHDPIGSLKKLRQWAAKDAWLVLSVPNAGSADFMTFKQYGYALHLPNHLYHYTPKTLEQVLRAGGWRLEKVYHQRLMSNWFGGLGQMLSAKGYDNRLVVWMKNYPSRAGKLHYLFLPLSMILACFGQTGRMTIWARRICDD
ncbi:class I SAM-dependent methyltransferase [Thiolapillus sp.]